jgi:hypothetical protein
METWPNIKGHNVTQFQHVKGAAPLEICQLLYGACVQQEVLKNGSNPDAQASPLQMTMCVN